MAYSALDKTLVNLNLERTDRQSFITDLMYCLLYLYIPNATNTLSVSLFIIDSTCIALAKHLQ